MFSSSYRVDPPLQSSSSLNRSFSTKNSSRLSSHRHHNKPKSSGSFSMTSGIRKRRPESVSIPSKWPPTATTVSPSFLQEPLDVSMVVNTPTANPPSEIITIIVGREQRIFAAHQDILCISPFFHSLLRDTHASPPNPFASPTTAGLPPTPRSNPASPPPLARKWAPPLAAGSTKRLALPEEAPEIFSSVLEFLYKGDYYPRLVHSKRRNTWNLERADTEGRAASTVYLRGMEGDLLKDTVVYCAAERYGLEELKIIALRKQGLQSGIHCSTILASARYAYANTPDSDAKLRAHYLALIIRSRGTFKRSGTMQMEMLRGGTPLFFDLFVALCNHVDDVSAAGGISMSSRFC